VNARDRMRLPDEVWFAEFYGSSVGAAAASIANPQLTAEFSALVSPLEKIAGKPLGEPGRQRCFAAFFENPDGFRRLVADAEKRGTRNAVGLLIRMVEAAEHREVAA
jgi:hypothetical protein